LNNSKCVTVNNHGTVFKAKVVNGEMTEL